MLEYELWIAGQSDPIYFDDYESLVYYLNNTLPSGTVCTCNVHSRMPKYTWVFNGPGANPMPVPGANAKAPTSYTRNHIKKSV